MNPENTNCPHCGAEAYDHFADFWRCGSIYYSEGAHMERTDLCREREAHNKTREELNGEIAWRRAKESETEKLHEDLTRADSLIRQSDLVFRNEEERRKKAEAENQKLRELLEEAISYLKKYESPSDFEEAKRLSEKLNQITK